jgi:hypothetical protein
VPEVVIKVKGSRRSQDSDHDAIAGLLRYMMYISRNGRLLTVDEQGQPIDRRNAVREAHASWDLDMQRMADGRGQSLHPLFNVIFSMPGKADANKVLDAVQAFARRHFLGHQYVMALHTKETDPADDPPEHPHVHLVLRAEDEDGRRIHIRKARYEVGEKRSPLSCVCVVSKRMQRRARSAVSLLGVEAVQSGISRRARIMGKANPLEQ